MSNIGNKRLAKNTLMLYIRMFFIMAVTLYTSRVVLSILGVVDYGIYNIVGGLIVTFSILTNSLSSIGSRFLSVCIGKQDDKNLKAVYTNILLIQITLSAVIIIFGETLGLWFLNYKLDLPVDRYTAANWVYQFSILTFIVRLLLVPYHSLIIAREHMSVYAYGSIFECVLQLSGVFLLFVLPGDSLVQYSLIVSLVNIFILIFYHIYCNRKFEECTLSLKIERSLFKEMLSFAGWNFIGSSAGILRNQGVDIIVNMFFGVTVNAARGISNQVNTAVTKFSQNFMTAVNPQITKSYAAKDINRLTFLVLNSSRYSFYLLLIVCLPILIYAPYILALWLKNIPPGAIIFVRLQLIISMIAVLSNSFITAMLATNNIKIYQIVVGSITLLNFPVSYIVLKLGGDASSTYIVAISIEFVTLIARLIMSKHLIGIGPYQFFTKTFPRIIITTTISILCLCTLQRIYPVNSFLEFTLILTASIIILLTIIFLLGLNKGERVFVITKLKSKFIKHHD